MKVIETQFTRYTLGDDGIGSATPLHPELPRTAELMAETLEDLTEFLGGTPRPFVWDPRTVLPLPPGAWRTIIDSLDELVVALAILVDDDRKELVGSFPFAIDTLMLPVRIFTNEADARQWLLEFVEV